MRVEEKLLILYYIKDHSIIANKTSLNKDHLFNPANILKIMNILNKIIPFRFSQIRGHQPNF